MEENDGKAAGPSPQPVLSSAIAVQHDHIVGQITDGMTSATGRTKAAPVETADR